MRSKLLPKVHKLLCEHLIDYAGISEVFFLAINLFQKYDSCLLLIINAVIIRRSSYLQIVRENPTKCRLRRNFEFLTDFLLTSSNLWFSVFLLLVSFLFTVHMFRIYGSQKIDRENPARCRVRRAFEFLTSDFRFIVLSQYCSSQKT